MRLQVVHDVVAGRLEVSQEDLRMLLAKPDGEVELGAEAAPNEQAQDGLGEARLVREAMEELDELHADRLVELKAFCDAALAEKELLLQALGTDLLTRGLKDIGLVPQVEQPLLSRLLKEVDQLCIERMAVADTAARHPLEAGRP
mmetsp:Transcript_21596/g.60174  ORF Transcript_21596/g.60174 Transcript_21596/m.60174 type:complete len:145 (+) Transcript_21596:3-437(+)